MKIRKSNKQNDMDKDKQEDKQEDENGQKDNDENKDKQKTRINKKWETIMKMKTMNDANDIYLLNTNITVVLQINSNIPWQCHDNRRARFFRSF